MNKSKQETHTRNLNSKQKSGNAFHHRSKKRATKWKQEQTSVDDDRTDLKFKTMTNGGVADRKNQMKPNRKIRLGQGKPPTMTTTSDKRGKSALPNKATTTRKELAPESERPAATKPVEESKAAPSPKQNGKQKRKAARNGNGLAGTKPKKQKKHSSQESDSDADDYMDRFFDDVSDGEASSSTEPDSFGLPLGDGDVEEEEEDDLDESDSEDGDRSDDEEEDEVAMSLEELVDYFGQRRDELPSGKPGKKDKQRKQSKSSQCSNGWVEEDNDVELVYKDSDEEKDDGSRALVPVGEVRNAESDEDGDQDYSEDDSLDEEEDENAPFDLEAYLRGEIGSEDDSDYSDEEEEEEEDSFGSASSADSDSFEEEGSEEDSDDDEYGSAEEEEEASEVDDHEFSSDYDSDEDEDDDSDDSDDDDEFPSYWDESYDSEEDEDYIGEGEDDLYISRGAARVYDIDENEVSFFSDVETAQIVELPVDDRRSRSVGTSGAESQEDGGEDDDVECPVLVPIYDAQGNLIDSPEKLEQSKSNSVERKKSRKSSVSVPVQEQEKMEEDVQEDVQQDTMEEDVQENVPATSSYRFYDSLDMRISLLVLKETLYVSGHLTVQPLIGGLEVMGYNLRPGECRGLFAVRGFHSLNLTPHPQTGSHLRETMEKVMARVEKHFHEADLKEILARFDASNSVLVLLQADCNNKRIETVDKYLSEDFLFPKVEFMKKSPFFRTEYLLNVEFCSEQVDKSTSLYRSDPEWDKIAVKNNSKIVVMGGKGSGKSTLCQYLINKNVEKFKKVVLIDLDIGQPIQHIPETISVTIVDRPLLGVATFQPIQPAKSWLFGSLDIVSSLIFYTQNVRQLLRYCDQHKSELANVPWVINTMGYVSDFGEELMATILRMFCPTDVIQLVSTDKLLAIPNYQNRLTSEFIAQYNYNILRSEVKEYVQRKPTFKHYELNVCYPKKGFTLNAPKRRNLMLLAHLADILQDSSSEWFNEVKPFCAPLSQLQVLITREDQTLAEDQLPSVLNATLVYLCRKDDAGLYECLGIGIVRGVDKNNNVYLLQSLPDERLAEVNVLAICSSSLPNAAFLRQSARIQGSIPYVYNID